MKINSVLKPKHMVWASGAVLAVILGIGKDAGENLTPGLRLPPVQETRPFSSGLRKF